MLSFAFLFRLGMKKFKEAKKLSIVLVLNPPHGIYLFNWLVHDLINGEGYFLDGDGH